MSAAIQIKKVDKKIQKARNILARRLTQKQQEIAESYLTELLRKRELLLVAADKRSAS